MAWSVVNTYNAQASISSNTASVTLNFNTTTGDALFVAAQPANNTTISSINVSAGSASFSKLVGLGSGLGEVEIWGAANITGGTTPTVNVVYASAPGTGTEMTVYQASGGPTSLTTDGTNSNASSGTSVSTGQITTTVNGDLVLKASAFFSGSGSPNGTPQTGWTEVNPTVNGNIAGYIVQGTAGAITGTDTLTSSDSYVSVIAAVKPPGGTITLPSTTMNWLQGITGSPKFVFKLPSTTLNWSQGISAAPVKAVLATTNMAWKAGITGSPKFVFQIPSVNLAWKAGITNNPKFVFQLANAVALAWKAGITSDPIKVVLVGNIPFKVGITSAPLTGASPGAPPGLFIFTDQFGVHRVVSVE